MHHEIIGLYHCLSELQMNQAQIDWTVKNNSLLATVMAMVLTCDQEDIASAYIETLKLSFRWKSNFRHKFACHGLPEVPLHHTKQRMMSMQIKSLNRVMGKLGVFLCENKGADELCSYCTADQRLCFRYTDSTIPLLPQSEISIS